MAKRYPSVLLTGYAADIELVAARLSQYRGTLLRAPENVIELADEWRSALVCYVFSGGASYSSQLKALFTALHFRHSPRFELVVLLPDTKSLTRNPVFPEMADIERVEIGELADYVMPDDGTR